MIEIPAKPIFNVGPHFAPVPVEMSFVMVDHYADLERQAVGHTHIFLEKNRLSPDYDYMREVLILQCKKAKQLHIINIINSFTNSN